MGKGLWGGGLAFHSCPFSPHYFLLDPSIALLPFLSPFLYLKPFYFLFYFLSLAIPLHHFQILFSPAIPYSQSTCNNTHTPFTPGDVQTLCPLPFKPIHSPPSWTPCSWWRWDAHGYWEGEGSGTREEDLGASPWTDMKGPLASAPSSPMLSSCQRSNATGEGSAEPGEGLGGTRRKAGSLLAVLALWE